MRKIYRYALTMVCVAAMLFSNANLTFAAQLPVTTNYEQQTKPYAIAKSSKKIELNWESVNGAKRYAVYRSTKKDSGFQKLDTVKKTIYTDKTVKAGTTYYYKIMPIDSSKKEMKKKAVLVKANTAQETTVTKLNVKSPTKVKLYWKKSRGANGYEIYRSNNQYNNFTLLATIDGRDNLAYTDATILAGKTYFYKVRPTVKGKNVSGVGSFSAPIKAKTVAKTEIKNIASTNSNTIQITWKKVKNAQGYELYRATKENGKYIKIATIKHSKNKYKDNRVTAGRKYYYKVVTIGKLNGKKITSGYSKAISNRALKKVNIHSVELSATDTLKITWKKVKGADSYKIYRATSSGGKYKKIATVKANGESKQSYTDTKVSTGKKYYYKVQAYSNEDGVIAAGKGDKSSYKSATMSYAIMGKSTVTVKQMVKLFESSGKKYPSHIYKDKGAKDIKKFCQIILDESEREGVRAEVIFAQVCLETGYLSFGGQVKAEQCNFSGIGATDDGAAGATFPSVRIGIRAQVQHLKGYASKDSLNQDCVDPRFKYLTFRRGTTPYVQQLGNGNWATDPNYAAKLMTLITKMKSY